MVIYLGFFLLLFSVAPVPMGLLLHVRPFLRKQIKRIMIMYSHTDGNVNLYPHFEKQVSKEDQSLQRM